MTKVMLAELDLKHVVDLVADDMRELSDEVLGMQETDDLSKVNEEM